MHFLTFESLTQIQIFHILVLIKFSTSTNRKKSEYNHRIMNVEHGTFTPLVFSINGGEGSECLAFHKHIAEKIASKTDDRFVMTWIRTKLSFLVLRAGLMCLRGSRSCNVRNQSGVVDDFRIACDNARIA